MPKQVRISPDGLWHRRARGHGLAHTACGITIIGPVAMREYTRKGNHLCPICWTRHEMDTRELEKLEADAAAEDRGLYFDEKEDPTDPNGSIERAVLAFLRSLIAGALAAFGLLFLFVPEPPWRIA